MKNYIQDSIALFGLNIGHKIPPGRPQDAPKMPPRRPQDGPKTPQDDPRTTQVPPKTASKSLSRQPQDRSETAGRWGTPLLAPRADGVPHFLLIFEAILVPTSRYLGALRGTDWISLFQQG